MRLAMVALAAGTGCAQLFGLDNTTGVDASADTASIQVQRVAIGATVIKGPQSMTGQTAKFFQADGAQVDGTLEGTDTFTTLVPGTPPVLFTVPDMGNPKRLLALPARDQKSTVTVFEHPNPQAPLPSSQIALSVTLPSPYGTETFALQSIGAWMQSAVPAPAAGATTISTTLNYATFTSMVGAPKARITMSDVTLLLRYTGNLLSGVLQAQFDQTDGADGMSGTMVAVTPDTMAGGMIDSANIATRVTAVRPAVPAPGLSWRVSAAPGWSVGSATGVTLHTAGVPATDTTFTTPMYGNPFASLDWKAVMTFSASTSRAYTYTEGTMSAATNLSAQMQQVSEPSMNLNINMPAGLPTTIRINQNLLTSDNTMLMLDLSKPVEVDAIIDKPTNTLYEMALVQLGLDTTGASPAVTKTIVLDSFTTASGMPTFKIPPELLSVGKTYYILFRCYQGGFTGAASGDLTTVSLPYASSALDSAVFTVGMP